MIKNYVQETILIAKSNIVTAIASVPFFILISWWEIIHNSGVDLIPLQGLVCLICLYVAFDNYRLITRLRKWCYE